MNHALTLDTRPASRTLLAADGRHANPDALLDHLADADARTTSSGLTWIAEHTSATALNAQARATFPRIVIEEWELPQGAFIVHHDATDRGVHRIAWDPAQTTRAQVEAYINLCIARTHAYVEYTQAAWDALRHLDLPARRAEDPRANAIEFWDCIETMVITSNDPYDAVERIAELLTAEQANR